MKSLDEFEIMPIFPQEPVSDPRISPDGERVVFTYNTINIEEDNYESHL